MTDGYGVSLAIMDSDRIAIRNGGDLLPEVNYDSVPPTT